MDGQQSDESFKKMFNLEKILGFIKKGINKRTKEKINKISDEEEAKKMLKHSIGRIEDLSYIIAKNAQEKTGISQPERSITSTHLYYDKHDNKHVRVGYYSLTTNIYGDDNIIECLLNKLYSPYKIECTKYSDRSSFELPDSSPIIESMKNSILNTLRISYRGVLTSIDNPRINISAYVYVDFKSPKKENPEIIKYGNVLIYDNRRSHIEIILGSYIPSEF
jgi:hypothetical protein